ncbi:MAG TPA: DUF1573 domain-containing protein, partial [Gemmataceae bacterium]|nr:DUF1573 domain-containing protein [Gemmataceae bacterium]
MDHGKLQAGHDLLDLLQTAHDSITGAIHTLHCRFDSRTDNEHGHFEDRGEYWRSLDSIRLRDRGSFPGGRTGTVVNMDDYAIIAGRLFIYNMQVQGEQKVAGGSINPPTGTGPDVWRLALLSFADPHHAQVTLDELLRKAHKSRRVRRVERWGHAVLCLEVVTDENALIEVWFDPQYNYLARKMTTSADWGQGKLHGYDQEVGRFIEVRPGCYFPERVESRYTIEGRLLGRGEAKFTEIQINQPIAAEIFHFRFPAGTEVLDTIQSKLYTATGSGALEEVKGRTAYSFAPSIRGHNPAPSLIDVPERELPATHMSDKEVSLATIIALLLVADVCFLLRRRAPRSEQPADHGLGLAGRLRRIAAPALGRLPWLAAPALGFALAFVLVRDPSLQRQWQAVFGGPAVLECPETIELGEQDWGMQVTARFDIRNIGHSVLAIDQIRTNCVCSSIDQDGEDGKPVPVETLNISPGARARVLLRVNIRSQVGAPFRSAVLFRTNDPSHPEARIEVASPNVRGGVTPVPTRVDFGTVRPGESASRLLEIRDTAIKPRSIKTVESSRPELFRVRLLSAKTHKGGAKSALPGTLLGRVEIRLRPSTPQAIRGYVQITLDDASVTQNQIPVTGTVRAPVEAIPGTVFLPRKSSSGPIYRITCVCRTTNDKPLHL